MRKSTLLMGLLLGCAAASAEYVVPVVSTPEAPKYYKVLSNRALTLQYANAPAPDGSTPTSSTPVEAGNGTFGTRPYVGLHELNRAAISLDTEIVPDATLYWSFFAAEGNTTGKLEDGVRFVNLFATDMVLFAGTGSYDYAHLTTDGTTLYATNLNYVNEAAEANGNPVVYTENSYSISKDSKPTARACFDVKNFLGNRQNWDTAPYVFMAAEWQPYSDFDVDPTTGACSKDANLNNGSVFYFEEATAAEVEQAKKDLVEYEKQLLAERGPEMIENAKQAALNKVIAYANVPALYSAEAVNAAVAKIEALKLDIADYSSIRGLNEGIAAYEAEAAKCLEGLAAGAKDKIVTFQNVSRPYQGNDGTPAFLAAGEQVEYDDDYNEIRIECLIVSDDSEDEACQWTLGYVDGAIRLYNSALECYVSSDSLFINQTWKTTKDADKAALFTIVGAPTDTLANDVENTVTIRAINVANGPSYNYSCIHAAGSGTNFNVVGYSSDAAMEGASSWYIKVVGEDPDGIASVAVDNTVKTNAIYDINGRLVNNITRSGLYIVNGKKVIVRK